MVAFRQVDIGGVGGGRLHAPAVNQQRAVNKQPHAVVGAGVKTVRAGRKIEIARPAGRKIINRDGRIGRAETPVKVNGHIVAHHGGRAGLIFVGPVFAAPIGNVDAGQRRGCRQRGGRRRRSVNNGHIANVGGVGVCRRNPAPAIVGRREFNLPPGGVGVAAGDFCGLAVEQNAQNGVIGAGAGPHVNIGGGGHLRYLRRRRGLGGGVYRADHNYYTGHGRDGGLIGGRDNRQRRLGFDARIYRLGQNGHRAFVEPARV